MKNNWFILVCFFISETSGTFTFTDDLTEWVYIFIMFVLCRLFTIRDKKLDLCWKWNNTQYLQRNKALSWCEPFLWSDFNYNINLYKTFFENLRSTFKIYFLHLTCMKFNKSIIMINSDCDLNEHMRIMPFKVLMKCHC